MPPTHDFQAWFLSQNLQPAPPAPPKKTLNHHPRRSEQPGDAGGPHLQGALRTAIPVPAALQQFAA